LPEETRPPRKVLVMTPEKAAELLMEHDTSGILYYTKEKRRDPFKELRDNGVEIVYPDP